MSTAMDENAVHRDVLIAFEYSHLHDDWVCPLKEALDGLTVQQAVWRPNGVTKSIWEIVLHLTTWTDHIVGRIQTGVRSRPPEGSWPPLPPEPTEAAWADAETRLWNALAGMRALLEATSITTLLQTGDQEYSYLGDLYCRFIHIAYHIGQITKLREWQASQ